MRIVLQRVTHACVETINDNTDIVDEQIDTDVDAVVETIYDNTSVVDSTFIKQEIAYGLVILVGISDTDSLEEVHWVAKKIANMRIFDDEHHVMNKSILQVNGSILSVSQFTLYANIRKGNRPNYIEAGKPEHAFVIWKKLNKALSEYGVPVKEGKFGAHMKVSLINDGPVTITINTDTDMPSR